jgi:hypothetical protein
MISCARLSLTGCVKNSASSSMSSTWQSPRGLLEGRYFVNSCEF